MFGLLYFRNWRYWRQFLCAAFRKSAPSERVSSEGYREKITELDNGKRKLQFRFFLFGKLITCTAMAALDESKSVQVGRDYLIVYDAETGPAAFLQRHLPYF